MIRRMDIHVRRLLFVLILLLIDLLRALVLWCSVKQWIDGLCATGSASAPHLQEALAEPVAHINTRLTDR